ncbi:MAG: hypothetical protein LBM27_04000 [Lactobacillaceae bacterium]|jgi:hypothetical protein|nr:hypothetical protein [Lactobacillaceae bacterium]
MLKKILLGFLVFLMFPISATSVFAEKTTTLKIETPILVNNPDSPIEASINLQPITTINGSPELIKKAKIALDKNIQETGSGIKTVFNADAKKASIFGQNEFTDLLAKNTIAQIAQSLTTNVYKEASSTTLTFTSPQEYLSYQLLMDVNHFLPIKTQPIKAVVSNILVAKKKKQYSVMATLSIVQNGTSFQDVVSVTTDKNGNWISATATQKYSSVGEIAKTVSLPKKLRGTYYRWQKGISQFEVLRVGKNDITAWNVDKNDQRVSNFKVLKTSDSQLTNADRKYLFSKVDNYTTKKLKKVFGLSTPSKQTTYVWQQKLKSHNTIGILEKGTFSVQRWTTKKFKEDFSKTYQNQKDLDKLGFPKDN